MPGVAEMATRKQVSSRGKKSRQKTKAAKRERSDNQTTMASLKQKCGLLTKENRDLKKQVEKLSRQINSENRRERHLEAREAHQRDMLAIRARAQSGFLKETYEDMQASKEQTRQEQSRIERLEAAVKRYETKNANFRRRRSNLKN